MLTRRSPGRALFQQYVRSRRESRAQDLIFDNFCQQLSAENVAEWTVLAANYDRNPVGPDPYYLGTSGTSLVSSGILSVLKQSFTRYDRGRNPPTACGGG